MAFGLYTGSEDGDELLKRCWNKLNLREYYQRLCDAPINGFIGFGPSIETLLADLNLRFCFESKPSSRRIGFEALYPRSAARLRIADECEADQLVRWRNELEELSKNLTGSVIFQMGSRSNVVIVFEKSKLGALKVRVNFWIDSFLLPQMMELELDQTYLTQFMRQLDSVLALA